MSIESHLAKAAAAELQARRALETSDHHAAVLRSWFAAFHAIRAGLMAAEAESEGPVLDLIANFGIRVVADGMVPLEVGRAVMDVWNAKSSIEMGKGPDHGMAERAVASASFVVDAVRTAVEPRHRRDSGVG